MIYQSLDGDGSITARVSSVEHSHYWAKAGVMIRENTAAGSKHAFALCSANAGIAFQRRVSTNGASSHTSGANAQAPYWVRLDRVGDTFSAYQSVDGVNWVLFGSSTITMQSNVLIGLVVTAHDDTKTCNATFDNVSVISAMAGNG